jgi:hypothetical protein
VKVTRTCFGKTFHWHYWPRPLTLFRNRNFDFVFCQYFYWHWYRICTKLATWCRMWFWLSTHWHIRWFDQLMVTIWPDLPYLPFRQKDYSNTDSPSALRAYEKRVKSMYTWTSWSKEDVKYSYIGRKYSTFQSFYFSVCIIMHGGLVVRKPINL